MAWSRSQHDTAKDMAIAIEVKFLGAALPERDQMRRPMKNPPLPETGYIGSINPINEAKKLQIWGEMFSAVARSISEVSGQQAISKHDIESLGAEERDFWGTHWVVKKSNSAEPLKGDADYGKFLWVPVEVNSPKMIWKDVTTFSTIRDVLNVLKSRHHMVSNCTCEVHIHVGRLDNRPFSLSAMKRMAMLLWLAEPTMRLVKDPLSPNFHQVYTWSSAAREHSRLAAYLRKEKLVRRPRNCQLEAVDDVLGWYLTHRNVRIKENQQALRYILGTRSYAELAKIMSGEGKPYHRLGYNFSAIGGENTRSRTKPRTVEARFLEATVADDIVLSWLQIFGTMMEVSLDGVETEGRFANTILRLAKEEGIQGSESSFMDLMDGLGIPASVYTPVQMMIRRIHTASEGE